MESFRRGVAVQALALLRGLLELARYWRNFPCVRLRPRSLAAGGDGCLLVGDNEQSEALFAYQISQGRLKPATGFETSLGGYGLGH